MTFVETPRERLQRRGYCTGPADGAPGGLGAVGLDRKANCCTCGKRVAVTVRGLFAHHKPMTTSERKRKEQWESPARRIHAFTGFRHVSIPGGYDYACVFCEWRPPAQHAEGAGGCAALGRASKYKAAIRAHVLANHGTLVDGYGNPNAAGRAHLGRTS